jgi:predicted small lipoprotein YifL
MKRIISVITAIALILSLCACGSTGNTEASETIPSAEVTQEAEPTQEVESQETGESAEEEGGDITSGAADSFTLTLIADKNAGSTSDSFLATSVISLPIEGEPASPSLIAFALADGLTEWTGLDFTINDFIFDGDSVTVDWSADSTLIAGLDDREQKEEFHMFDAISLNWFMMDAMAHTLRSNMDITEIYYSTDGGSVTFTNPEDMAAQGLSELPVDQPYEISAFYVPQSEGDWYDPTVEWDGTYIWNESGQFTNKILRMKRLSEGIVLFEFDIMEGSESEGEAEEWILSGIMSIGDDGIGSYDLEAVNHSIEFTMYEDGQTLDVTHTGDTPISTDGTYTFSEGGPEFSAESVVTILEHLPTNATSLNHNNGEYVIDYSEELDADGFYSAEASFVDTGEVFAAFLVASDMSAVYRVDVENEPVQIYGME